MCLIDYDCKPLALLRAYCIVDDRKAVKRCNDNLLAVVDCLTQHIGTVLVGNDGNLPRRVVEAYHGILQLTVQNTPVRDHKYGVENRLVELVVYGSKTVCKPRYAVGFAAARAVLYEIIFSCAALANVVHKFFNHVKLMIPRENDFRCRFACDAPAVDNLGVLVHLHTDIALQKRHQHIFSQNVFPKI